MRLLWLLQLWVLRVEASKGHSLAKAQIQQQESLRDLPAEDLSGSSIFIFYEDFHQFSSIFMDFHGFSSIFKDFHQFSSIFINFQGHCMSFDDSQQDIYGLPHDVFRVFLEVSRVWMGDTDLPRGWPRRTRLAGSEEEALAAPQEQEECLRRRTENRWAPRI